MQQVSQPAPFALKSQNMPSNVVPPREDRERRESFDAVYDEGSSSQPDGAGRDPSAEVQYGPADAPTNSKEVSSTRSDTEGSTSNNRSVDRNAASASAASPEDVNSQSSDTGAVAEDALYSSEKLKTLLDSARPTLGDATQGSKAMQSLNVANEEATLVQPASSLILGKDGQGELVPNTDVAQRINGATASLEQSTKTSLNLGTGQAAAAQEGDVPATLPKPSAELSRALLERGASTKGPHPMQAQAKDSSAQGIVPNQVLASYDNTDSKFGADISPKDLAPLTKSELTSSNNGPSWSVEAAKNDKTATPSQALDRLQTATGETTGTLFKIGALDGPSALGLESSDELFFATNGAERVSGVNGTVNSVAQSRSVSYPHLAAQLRENLPIPPNKPVEIALSPEELGRVRMVVTQVEAGVAIQITAERQETLDLMRRNLDELSRDLESLGYSEMSFSFDQEGEAFSDFGSTENEPSSEQLVLAADDAALQTSEQRNNASSRPGGLDIRV